MFNRLTQQVSAFALSLVFTAVILGGVDHLASVRTDGAAPDHQVVVITAQRLATPV